MTIDWDEIENKYSFRRVENGKYKTQVLEINVTDKPTDKGNYAINFKLKPLDGVEFPFSSAHWISFGNDNWRIHHLKTLITDMGVDEAKARKKIEECESAGDKERIVNTYRAMFKGLADTHPIAEVVVEDEPYKFRNKDTGAEEIRTNGHRTEFAGNSYMSPQTVEQLQKRYPGVPVAGENNNESADLGGEAVELDIIPF